jgi:hypothetical protein
VRIGGTRRQHRCRKTSAGEREQLTTIHNASLRRPPIRANRNYPAFLRD